MDCKRSSVTITIIKIIIMVITTTTTIIIVIITTTTIIVIIITIVSREQYPQMRGQWPAVGGGEAPPMVPLGRPSMHASRGDNMRRMMMVIVMVITMMMTISLG